MISIFSKLAIIFMTTIPCFLFAQNATISGKVMDEAGLPVEYATVSILNASDSNTVKNTTTDASGWYAFDLIKAGSYRLATTVIGSKKNIGEIFQFDGITSIKKDIRIKNSSVQTEEVRVSAQRQLVRMEDGKMIVDVENTLSNAGLTAVDVLQKSPGITIDQDGKIQLKGKAGVQVQIDDKTMYLSEEQLNNLLKSIPSDQIKQIEITTSPAAKYDATGNGGIINIKLKKGAYEGVNGTANTTLGQGVYHKANTGVNISYKKKKLTFNTGYQYNNRKNLSENISNRSNSDLTVKNHEFKSYSYFTSPMQSHNLNFNGDYAFTKKTSLTFDFADSYSLYNWAGITSTDINNPDLSNSQKFRQYNDGHSDYLNIYSSLGFKHKLDTIGSAVSGYGSYNKNIGFERRDFNTQYYDSLMVNNNNPYIFALTNRSRSDMFNIQIDFEKKFSSKLKIETGAKTYQLENNTPLDITIYENHAPYDASNHFKYTEGVIATYLMGSTTLGKFSLQGGVRLENTQITGNQSIVDSTFKRNYTNLFPSGNITYLLSQKTSFSTSYSRRITRPNGNDLNPLITKSNPFTAWGGDPYLVAQFADNVEVSSMFLGGVIIVNLNYTYVLNPIVWASKLQKNTDIVISGPRNLDYQKNYGVSISVNKNIAPWWSSNNNLIFNNNQFVGTTDFGKINNRQYGWSVKSTQTMKLPNDIGIEISGMYDSPSSYAFAYAYEKWQTNFAIQKKIFSKRATIKIAYNDIFRKFLYAGKTTMATTTTENFYRWDNRTFLVTFTYKFGNKLLIRD